MIDAKERAIRRAATILMGGMDNIYPGVTVIGVPNSLLKEVLDQMASSVDPKFKPGPALPPVRIGKVAKNE